MRPLFHRPTLEPNTQNLLNPRHPTSFLPSSQTRHTAASHSRYISPLPSTDTLHHGPPLHTSDAVHLSLPSQSFRHSEVSMNSVRLDIGGKKLRTSIDTLTGREPDSMLAAMFSGRHTLDRDDDGYIFIDRDGKHFRHILNWLRDGVISTKLEDSAYCELLKEAEYYQLSGLVDELNVLLSKKSEELSSDLTRIDIIKWKQLGHVKGIAIHLYGVNLSCIDLSNLDLRNIIFQNTCLRNVKFNGANLSGCDFSYSKIRETSFVGAILTKVTMPSFFNCSLRNVKFNGVKLDGVFFSRVDAESVIFDDATLSSCDFNYSNIRETSFVGATLKKALLTSAKLINCSFVRADLESIQLRNAIFKGSNLRGANLRGVDMRLACFDGADLGIQLEEE